MEAQELQEVILKITRQNLPENTKLKPFLVYGQIRDARTTELLYAATLEDCAKEIAKRKWRVARVDVSKNFTEREEVLEDLGPTMEGINRNVVAAALLLIHSPDPEHFQWLFKRVQEFADHNSALYETLVNLEHTVCQLDKLNSPPTPPGVEIKALPELEPPMKAETA